MINKINKERGRLVNAAPRQEQVARSQVGSQRETRQGEKTEHRQANHINDT
jgi:hypothetical protein